MKAVFRHPRPCTSRRVVGVPSQLWLHLAGALVGSGGAGGLLYLIEKQWNGRLRIGAEEEKLRADMEKLRTDAAMSRLKRKRIELEYDRLVSNEQ